MMVFIRGRLLSKRLYRKCLSPVAKPMIFLLFVLLAIAFLVFVIGVAPRLLYPPIGYQDLSRLGVTGQDAFTDQNDRLMLQNAARTALLQGLAGLAVLIGLYFTWRQVKTSRDMHSTDRFIRAVDQIGRPDKTTEVALGGIYGLERVARDSPADRRSIGEILTAYVRTRNTEFSDKPDETLPSLLMRAPDVQAAISVLGRGKFSDIRLLIDRDIHVLDLSETDLRGADLSNLDLRGAWMNGAKLHRAFLVDADLSWVQLGEANMQHIIANGTTFSDASFYNADCKDGHFDHANFDGAILHGVDMQGAHLAGASFRDAFLGEANLSGANIKGAVFKNTEADDTTVWPADFDPTAFSITVGIRDKDFPSVLPPTRPSS